MSISASCLFGNLEYRSIDEMLASQLALSASRDIIARFGGDPSYQLPPAFFDDFVRVLPSPQCLKLPLAAVNLQYQ